MCHGYLLTTHFQLHLSSVPFAYAKLDKDIPGSVVECNVAFYRANLQRCVLPYCCWLWVYIENIEMFCSYLAPHILRMRGKV